MITISINTECGHMIIAAESVEDAKDQYSQRHGYDFDPLPTDDYYESSWYEITNYETGEEIESWNLEARPN